MFGPSPTTAPPAGFSSSALLYLPVLLLCVMMQLVAWMGTPQMAPFYSSLYSQHAVGALKCLLSLLNEQRNPMLGAWLLVSHGGAWSPGVRTGKSSPHREFLARPGSGEAHGGSLWVISSSPRL